MIACIKCYWETELEEDLSLTVEFGNVDFGNRSFLTGQNGVSGKNERWEGKIYQKAIKRE